MSICNHGINTKFKTCTQCKEENSEGSNDNKVVKKNPYHIDSTRLDRELLKQPELYHKAAVGSAKAKNFQAEAARTLDVVYADLYLKISLNPKDYGLKADRPTVDTIKSTLFLQQEYKDALKAVDEAKYSVNIHQANETALDQKKRCLEKLVDLFLHDYFSNPKIPKGASREDIDDVLRNNKLEREDS